MCPGRIGASTHLVRLAGARRLRCYRGIVARVPAGEIVRKEVREVLGQRREYLTIQIPHNGLTIMVPSEHAARAGLRKVSGEAAVDQVIAVLRGEGTHMPTSWKRRFKHNHEKINGGECCSRSPGS